MAKHAAPQGDGPWKDAIQYWLRELHLRQAHIVEGTGIPANTISAATRGLDVHMNTLRRIAEFFQVPFESVLVSPERRLSPAEERRLVEQLAADARRVIDQSRPTMPPRRSVDPRLLGIAKRLEKLPTKLQKSAVQIIALYERQLRQERKLRRGSPRPSKQHALQALHEHTRRTVDLEAATTTLGTHIAARVNPEDWPDLIRLLLQHIEAWAEVSVEDALPQVPAPRQPKRR